MSEVIGKGYTDVNKFRQVNEYENTEELFRKKGLTAEIENKTPPVAVNIAHLANMISQESLIEELFTALRKKEITVAILGLSSAQGPRDFQNLLKGFGVNRVKTIAIDISDGIFGEVMELDLDEVICLQCDARTTPLSSETVDIVLRDHLGNCCPPMIDRTIDEEVTRILTPGGISIVNITTSELLPQSEGREVINFVQLQEEIDKKTLKALQEKIYDLEDFKKMFPRINVEAFRGPIIEIEEGGSFVVFGEDLQGHGEWFRSLEDHLSLFKKDGFEIVGMSIREGWDSHKPPLRCQRHNIVLKKLLV